jgi:enamine deaminase RidA (YjgF/YER057c/UK114 family)
LSAKSRFINPDTMFVPPGYTQVVETTGPGRIVYIAGQLGIDKNGRLPGDFRAQAKQTYENLKNALASVGGKMEHIVKLNNYLLDIGHISLIREVRASYLNSDAPPASTTLQVSGFALVGALLEIEAVAILPAKTARPKTAASKAKPAKRVSKKATAKTAKTAKNPAARKRR